MTSNFSTKSKEFFSAENINNPLVEENEKLKKRRDHLNSMNSGTMDVFKIEQDKKRTTRMFDFYRQESEKELNSLNITLNATLRELETSRSEFMESSHGEDERPKTSSTLAN